MSFKKPNAQKIKHLGKNSNYGQKSNLSNLCQIFEISVNFDMVKIELVVENSNVD